MYIFKTEMPVKINQSKACEIIGLAQPTLSNILNGKVACRKVVAFCIAKYLDENAEIEDYFIREENKNGKSAKENGSTDIANELLEAIYSSNFNAPQLDIIYCLIRYTYGFHRKSHKLSINFIAKATKRHKITISKELVKLIDKNVINVEQKSTYSTSRILSLNKNYSIWGVSQNETVSQSETVSQNVTSTVSQNETVGVSQNETKKLKKETKKETKDIHTKSDDFGSVCQSVFDYFDNCGIEEDFKNKMRFKVNRENETILEMLEKICDKYSTKQIKDVIYQAYNNHVEFEWRTKAGKSSIEFYNLKTILKPDKFKKYLEQYEEG